MMRTDPEEELRVAFKVFDKEGNNLIKVAEVRLVMNVWDEEFKDVEELDEMIIDADVNGDGLINYEEFLRMLMAHWFRLGQSNRHVRGQGNHVLLPAPVKIR